MTTATQEQSGLRAIFVDQMPSVRRALHSVQELDTQVLTLSPAFLDALRELAPRRRGRHLRQVLLAALLLVIAVFAADPSLRSLVRTGGHHAVAMLLPRKAPPVVPAGPAPAIDAAVVVTQLVQPAPVLEIAPIEIAAGQSASPAAKPVPKKARMSKGRSHGGRG